MPVRKRVKHIYRRLHFSHVKLRNCTSSQDRAVIFFVFISLAFTDIAVACMMIGLAWGILVVLQAGHIVDTVAYGLSGVLVAVSTVVW